MPAKIPAHVRVEQINNLPNITFVRWDGEYRNNTSKAVYRCDSGHERSACVKDLLDGKGCPQCAVLSGAATRRTPTDERIAQINNQPNIMFVRWLDGTYRNKNSKAVCRCDSGHEWSAGVDNLVRGRGCPKCAGNRRWAADERIAQINNQPNIMFVRWLDGYRNCDSKATCRCDDGHEWSARVHDLVRGRCCPKCAEHGYNPSKPGTLYALLSECGTMVKVGISNDYEQRHRQLARATPFNWECTELLHGDGAMIASLEKAFHGMTEPVPFSEPFDGYTEWRKWIPEITNWFSTWKSLTPKENENV